MAFSNEGEIFLEPIKKTQRPDYQLCCSKISVAGSSSGNGNMTYQLGSTERNENLQKRLKQIEI